MQGIILHYSVLRGAMVHLFYRVTDSSGHIVQVLQSFVIRTSLYRLRLGIDGQVYHTIGTVTQLLYLLIPVVQEGFS